MEKRTIAIVDGNSLLHRAFHALPVTLTGADGRPTNAVYGFLTMLFRLVEELEPFGVVVAFDKGKPAFRTEVLECYKIHRPPTIPELKDQFPMMRHVLTEMDVPVSELDGWEGDDILGTLAEQAKTEGYDVLLITSDKDAMQLVDDRVRVVRSGRKIGDLAIYGPDEVFERFSVTPEQIVDHLGLMGDSSDNIPGVPGIGQKTAAKLLGEYGSLDGLLERADEVKGKVGENLRSHRQDALDSRTVATIRRDVPVQVDLEAAEWGGWDPARVLAAFKEMRVTSLIDKVLAQGEIDVAEARSEADSAQPHPLLSGADAAAFVREALEDGGEGWLGVVLGEEDESCLLPGSRLVLSGPKASVVVDPALIDDTLVALLERGRIASPDLKALYARAGEHLGAVDPSGLFDVGVAAYVLDSAASRYEVQALRADILGAPIDAGDDGVARDAADAQAAAELAAPMLERLESAGSLDCFRRFEMPLIAVLERMERAGVALDRDVLDDMSVEMATDIQSLSAQIVELAGEDFNIDSPKQLSQILFEKLGLPKGKRTKTGFSTDGSVLAPLADEYPIAGKVLDYRELAKLKSTYVDALPRLLDGSGRIHTTFNQTVAATGRLSSSNPNLQNIPVRTELGREIRSAFVPGPGYDLLLAADYSQIELRILAHASQDPGLIEAFTGGADFHAATAARVFGVDADAVDQGLRSRAKATNFGIVYGISAHGLALQLGIERAEAQEMIDRYYTAYPDVRAFLDESVARARETGYAVTMFGRRRPIPELASRNHNVRSFGERTAMNHPMQGAAADIMKLAMVEVDARLAQAGLASRMVLQVHDELVFEVVATEREQVAELACDAMTGVAELRVPLEVDVGYGADWTAAK